MNLAELRTALASALEAVDPAPNQIFAKMKAQITPPTLVVAFPEEVDFHHTMAAAGESRWTMVVIGIAAGGLYDESAQDVLDQWLSDEGVGSVAVALEADPSLGGLVSDVTVMRSAGYQAYAINNVAYLGCDWTVDVVA